MSESRLWCRPLSPVRYTGQRPPARAASRRCPAGPPDPPRPTGPRMRALTPNYSSRSAPRAAGAVAWKPVTPPWRRPQVRRGGEGQGPLRPHTGPSTGPQAPVCSRVTWTSPVTTSVFMHPALLTAGASPTVLLYGTLPMAPQSLPPLHSLRSTRCSLPAPLRPPHQTACHGVLLPCHDLFLVSRW